MISLRKGNLKLAAASLKASKMRSFLTMLGIVIGVSAVICVVCIGQGVKQQIAKQVSSYGPDIITIRPGTGTNSSVSTLLSGGGISSVASTLLTDKDLETVRTTPGVAYTVPLAVASGTAKGDQTVTSPLVIATGPDFPKAINQKITLGGFFDPDPNNQTVVLGQNIARELFDDSAPLGQSLTYRGQQFIVTGVFGSFASGPFSLSANFNDAIFLPYSTAQTLNGGGLAVYQILAKADAKQDVSTLAAAIDKRLTRSHGGAQQNTVLTPKDTATGADEVLHLLTLLIVGVAAIALLVGGVGIMNVMLVSVTERMHEIGIRKAIGATNRQIARQFMVEALMLSTTGAILGVVLSLVTVGLLRAYSSLQPVLVWQVFVLAPIAAIAVGVLFGTAPAMKAARKDPIEALRHQ
jgi:putative ABC transport system permease protein